MPFNETHNKVNRENLANVFNFSYLPAVSLDIEVSLCEIKFKNEIIGGTIGMKIALFQSKIRFEMGIPFNLLKQL